MCKECSSHGEKGAWYLNERNYLLQELVGQDEYPKRIDFLERFQSNRKNFYMDVLEETVIDTVLGRGRNMSPGRRGILVERIKDAFYDSFEYYHGAQIVPLSDALKIVDIPDRIYLFNCVCSQIYDASERPTCLCFNTLGDIMNQFPDYHVHKYESNIISRDEAREIIIREADEGSIHSIYYYIHPYVGALCNCRMPFCPNLKNYIWGGKNRSIQAGEYKASFNENICASCIDQPCVERCQFGSLNRLDGRLSRKNEQCMGCGSCMLACSTDAITLNSRREEGTAWE